MVLVGRIIDDLGRRAFLAKDSVHPPLHGGVLHDDDAIGRQVVFLCQDEDVGHIVSTVRGRGLKKACLQVILFLQI